MVISRTLGKGFLGRWEEFEVIAGVLLGVAGVSVGTTSVTDKTWGLEVGIDDGW